MLFVAFQIVVKYICISCTVCIIVCVLFVTFRRWRKSTHTSNWYVNAVHEVVFWSFLFLTSMKKHVRLCNDEHYLGIILLTSFKHKIIKTYWALLFFVLVLGTFFASEVTVVSSCCAKHFSNWCEVYEAAIAVYGNQSNNLQQVRETGPLYCY